MTITSLDSPAITALKAKADERNALKEQIAALSVALKTIDGELIAGLEEQGLDKIEGIVTKGVTKAQATVTWFEAAEVQALISAKAWNRITDRVLNKSRFDAELACGRIKLDDVISAQRTRTNAAYILER